MKLITLSIVLLLLAAAIPLLVGSLTSNTVTTNNSSSEFLGKQSDAHTEDYYLRIEGLKFVSRWDSISQGQVLAIDYGGKELILNTQSINFENLQLMYTGWISMQTANQTYVYTPTQDCQYLRLSIYRDKLVSDINSRYNSTTALESFGCTNTLPGNTVTNEIK